MRPTWRGLHGLQGSLEETMKRKDFLLARKPNVREEEENTATAYRYNKPSTKVS